MSLHQAQSTEVRTREHEALQDTGRRPELREQREVSANRAMEAGFKDKAERERILNLPRVEGFDQSGVMNDQEVRDYLKDTLPEKHANNISMDSVRYHEQTVSTQGGVELGHWESEQKQTFLQPDQEIVINEHKLQGDKGQEQMKNTLTHEVGHQTYAKFLPESDRQAWEKLSGDRAQTECVNEYARTDQFEDFAVSYRAYVRDPRSLKQVSPEKYEFMRDKVFEGREYK